MTVEVFQKLPPKLFFMASRSDIMNLLHTGLSELYKEIESLGDPLSGIVDLIDFERIRSILSDICITTIRRREEDPIMILSRE